MYVCLLTGLCENPYETVYDYGLLLGVEFIRFGGWCRWSISNGWMATVVDFFYNVL